MINNSPELLRMMDANINRAAEGLRVVEDYLRFVLEDKEKCTKVRALRHQIRKLFAKFYPDLLAKRNIQTDPGKKISQEQQLDNKLSGQDLLTANLKRTQEGLRVLEETSHLLGQRELAKFIESLRFEVYDLEAKLLPYFSQLQKNTRVHNKMKVSLPSGIYAITSEEHSRGRSNLEVAKEILHSGVKILQYREKDKKQAAMYKECQSLRQMTREAGAVLLINDHIEIALAVGADGVHIGQDDLPVKVVREMLGEEKIIGLSTHSPEQANAAVADGADYIGVGPIFKTFTKKDVCEPVGLEYLNYVVKNIKLPFVAIGGIKEFNIEDVVKAGAKSIALVTEIVGSENIRKKIQDLNKIITRG